MSDNLVRRQKFARDLRKQEVQAYMRNIRQRLLIETNLPQQPAFLSPQEFEQMRRELEEQHYCTSSVEVFLLKLKAFTIESLCTDEVFTAVEVAILHVLKRGENDGPQALVHRLTKELLLRAIEAGPNQHGSLPMECCFKEVQEILGNPDTEMLDVWKAMALVRSQAIYQSNFINFLALIKILDSIDDVIPTILEVFANFTAKIEDHEKAILSVTGLFTVIDKLGLILQNYTLCGADIATVTRALSNMFKTHCFKAVIQLLVDSQIFPEIVTLLKDPATEQSAISSLMDFLVLTFSEDDTATIAIIRKHPEIIPVLAGFLPGFGNVNPFETLRVELPKQWRMVSRPSTNEVMTCFANLAACKGSTYFNVTNRITDWYISFSSFPEPNVRAEVAIYFYNLCAMAEADQMEVILEKGVLQALNNLIREEYLVQSALYAMKALLFVVRECKNFPSNNMAWNFSLRRVRIECQRMELVKYLQGMMVSKKEELVHYANLCLNQLVENEPV